MRSGILAARGRMALVCALLFALALAGYPELPAVTGYEGLSVHSSLAV